METNRKLLPDVENLGNEVMYYELLIRRHKALKELKKLDKLTKRVAKNTADMIFVALAKGKTKEQILIELELKD